MSREAHVRICEGVGVRFLRCYSTDPITHSLQTVRFCPTCLVPSTFQFISLDSGQLYVAKYS